MTGLIVYIPAVFPVAYFQGRNWHVVEAKLKRYRGEKKDYTSEEINGRGKQLQKGQTRVNLHVPGLHHSSWQYIQPKTLEELEANRAILVALLRPQYQKKNPHGLADARGLTGAEIAALELKTREVLAQKKNLVTLDTPEEEDDDLTVRHASKAC